MKNLSGRDLAGFVKERQAHQVAGMARKPRLLILRDSDNPVIVKYVNLKKKYGEDIDVEVIDTCVDIASLREEIVRANGDDSIDGIIIQLPLMDKAKTDELCDLIAPEKDVDGLGINAKFDSATATATMWLLAGYDVKLEKARIALVGRGKLVGAPLYRMFTNSHYDVDLLHRGSDLTNLIQYDIIISATGVPGLIRSEYIKSGAYLVDAGTASENGVIKGDLAPEVRERTDLAGITPVIGGIGPLTVACLFDHVIQAATNR